MIKRLVITGYKAHELGIFNDKHPGIGIIKKALENQLTPLLDSGLEWVIISGQPGVETWAAETVIDLQDLYPELKFAVITPFQEQEKNWNEAKKGSISIHPCPCGLLRQFNETPLRSPLAIHRA